MPTSRDQTTSGPGAVVLAFVASASLFALSSTLFQATPTDLSAWRMLRGDVPYRDFWTMYAPGSFTVLSWLYALFGREMIVSRVAGGLTSAAAVALYFVLARRLGGVEAWLSAGMTAGVFFATGYHTRFGSYPPAMVLLLAAVLLLTRRDAVTTATDPRQDLRRVAAAGLLGGTAVAFKHDVAGYALVALAVAVWLTAGIPWRDRTRAVVVLAVSASVPVGLVVVWLWRAGAVAPMVDALVRFPLTEFPSVRPESFPWWPTLQGDTVANVRAVVHWLECQAPSVTVIAALVAQRHSPSPRPLAWWWALAVYPLFWTAAHVQLNTHAISLTAMAWLVAAPALGTRIGTGREPGARAIRRWRNVACAGAALWIGAVMIEPGYRVIERWRQGVRALDLPHLALIAAPEPERAALRGLAGAIAAAAPPHVPLLMLAARNDTVIYAELVPYWLSDRAPATPFHELHPAITDTARGHARMLAAIDGGPVPVLVREHRFDDGTIDAVKRSFQSAGVAVGSAALDAWVAEHYTPGPTFGRYELMTPRAANTAPR